jgi:triosephosphate isomerase
MNTEIPGAIDLAAKISKFAEENYHSNVNVLICPPFLNICRIVHNINDEYVKIGAQNCHFEKNGAFTGEISAPMLKHSGCSYVILGHSERRELFKESDEFINKKIKSVLEEQMFPILCIGEKLEERKSGKTFDILKSQLKGSLEGLTLSDIRKVTIAYEPVWAIGTGVSATPEQAQETHKWIKDYLKSTYGDASEDIKILYGGSMKETNAEELLKLPDVDGGLIGGASLKAESFTKIIEIANKLSK